MSKKQTVKAKPNKKAELERKRDEKAARRALAKERKNRAQGGGSDDEEFASFANQLQAMALKLREVPGDGNCLFRALADQLEGHSRNHLKHRQETVDYMLGHREDFEPFVEDDVPFERHVANLRKLGTFAGNDAIVAFARNNRVNVVIHQLNAPLWQICGLDKPEARELHIAYRYGEHYDSVRRISDNSETPAALKTEMFSKDGARTKCKNRLQNCHVDDIDFEVELEDEVEDAVQKVQNATGCTMFSKDGAKTKCKNRLQNCQVEDINFEVELEDEVADAVHKVRNATGCTDDDVILQNLEAENYNIESAVVAVLQLTELNHFSVSDESAEKCQNQPIRPSLVENDSGTKDWGNNRNCEKHEGTEKNRAEIDIKKENKLKKSTKLSNKQRKEQQRLEKKKTTGRKTSTESLREQK